VLVMEEELWVGGDFDSVGNDHYREAWIGFFLRMLGGPFLIVGVRLPFLFLCYHFLVGVDFFLKTL
jgi:hypothetical protein